MMPARIRLKATRSESPKRKRAKAVYPDREGQFRKLFMAFAPTEIQPEAQHVFHETRKWRFDFAWPHAKVAVEIDGGVFQKRATGHRSISGVANQMEKLNAATELGWRILRFHANDLDKRPQQTVDMCLRLIRCRPLGE